MARILASDQSLEVRVDTLRGHGYVLYDPRGTNAQRIWVFMMTDDTIAKCGIHPEAPVITRESVTNGESGKFIESHVASCANCTLISVFES